MVENVKYNIPNLYEKFSQLCIIENIGNNLFEEIQGLITSK